MNKANVRFRQHRPEDAAELAQLAHEAAEADRVDPGSTLEGIPSEQDLTNPEILIAEDAETGRIVGYGAIRWWQEDDGTRVYLHSGTVRPEVRGKGIGSKLLEELQNRASTIASQKSAITKVFGANATETEKDTEKLLLTNDYQKVWSQVEMKFTNLDALSQLPTPDGFELRPVSNDQEKRQVYDANKAVYAGQFGNSQPSDEDYQEFLEDNPDTSLWKVLWHDNDVAGFVLSRMRPNGAEVMEVSVLPEFRRRGLGTFLMIESMLELRRRGVDEIRLHTGTEGKMGGRQLYESLGFRALKEHYRYRKTMR
jgi:mycothiol synthase